MAQRIRAGAALIVVFLLVVATNRMDSTHFEMVQRDVTSIYNDRLLAKDYIYKISRQLQLKKNSLYNQELEDIYETNKKANDSIRFLVEKFSETELTEREARRFSSLQTNLDQLFQQERFLQKGELVDEVEIPIPSTTEKQYERLFADLDVLAEIQVEEGWRKAKRSSGVIDTSNLLARLEIGILIVIGILFQLVIFLKPLK